MNIIANILLQGKTVQIVSNNNSATDNVYEKSMRLKNVFDKQEELANLKQEQAQLATEVVYFNQYIGQTDIDINRIEFKKIFHKHSIGHMITMFQAMYYREREAELIEKIAEIEDYLKNVDGDLLNDLCSQSMAMLKDKLARKYEGNVKRKVFDEDDLWKNPYDVLIEYPVVLSTTFSSRNSLNADVVMIILLWMKRRRWTLQQERLHYRVQEMPLLLEIPPVGLGCYA